MKCQELPNVAETTKLRVSNTTSIALTLSCIKTFYSCNLNTVEATQSYHSYCYNFVSVITDQFF